ncbi:MAG: class I SAM-dependent methyltransferase [Patescibacteria group bacterium]|jgi:2-polyprenyl-3-methyl-5-hydroxy-6-metoxy-1,4-benzoquinol methylase
MAKEIVSSSFRDPSGFVYFKNGTLYRQINLSYAKDYDRLMNSGLYRKLTDIDYLIKHEEVKLADEIPGPAYKVIKPEVVPFVSYPYEWSFSQLKDAALLTLKIQKIALEHQMSLKDASAYNVFFVKGRPILIDTLSFEIYEENKPWIAYRQFCQHFLASLSLMAKVDLRFGSLSAEYLDGLPLDLASHLLPFKTKFSLGLASHIHLHAFDQVRYANKKPAKKNYRLSRNQLMGIINNLEATIKNLKIRSQKTTWGNYYLETNYTAVAKKEKAKIIKAWIKKIAPKTVWDVGANDGTFSRIASEMKISTVATDFDPLAIESAYLQAKERDDQLILPLVIDITNPSPAIGWANEERLSFLERAHFDLTLCLALIHHLVIANNLPLSHIAETLQAHTKYLIIEFVPKNDSNTRRLLAHRKNIFSGYTQKNFEKEFSQFFELQKRERIRQSLRTLYLMKNKRN